MTVKDLSHMITEDTECVQIFQLSEAIRVYPGDKLEVFYYTSEAPMEIKVTHKDGSTKTVTSHNVIQRDVRWTLNRYPDPPR